MFLAKEISSKDALKAWNKAKEVSLFCNPEYLSLMNHDVIYLGGFKNKELLAVWPILMDEVETDGVLPYSYYFGPFSINSYKDLPPYKAYNNHLDIYSSLIEEVIKVKELINFSLIPEFLDLRPFQWWNYHDSHKKHFHIDVKYTAQYDLNEFDNHDELLQSFRPDDKRKKLKKLISQDEFYISIEDDFNPIFLSGLYKETLNKSGFNMSKKNLDYLIDLMNLANKSFQSDLKTYILQLKSKNNDEIHGFQLLLIGKQKSYAIAQSVTNYARSKSASILLTYHAIQFSKKIGCQCFDFNGANSPKRGDDKHSFGAHTVPYMDLYIK